MKTIQFFLLGILLSVYVTSCSSDEQGIEKETTTVSGEENGLMISLNKVGENNDERVPLHITSNIENKVFNAGEVMEIRWSQIGTWDWRGSKLDIYLYKEENTGNVLYEKIVENYDTGSIVSGAYNWNIQDLESGRYFFGLFRNDSHSWYSFSAAFEVIGDIPGVKITNPEEGLIYYSSSFNDLTVFWKDKLYNDTVDILIYKDDVLIHSENDYQSNLEQFFYNFKSSGDGYYKVLIKDSEDTSISDEVNFRLIIDGSPVNIPAITFPNDGDIIADFTTVKWDKSQFPGKVDIKIYVDGSLKTIKEDYNNNGDYSLNFSSEYSGIIKFVLIDSQDSSRYDEVVFDGISAITFPNDGAFYAMGGPFPWRVEWITEYFPSNDVRIETYLKSYSTGQYDQLIFDGVIDNDGSFTAPNSFYDGEIKITVSSGSISDSVEFEVMFD